MMPGSLAMQMIKGLVKYNRYALFLLGGVKTQFFQCILQIEHTHGMVTF